MIISENSLWTSLWPRQVRMQYVRHWTRNRYSAEKIFKYHRSDDQAPNLAWNVGPPACWRWGCGLLCGRYRRGNYVL